MNIAARLARFEDRGFSRETAAVNVLLEQALQVLLSAFPDTFVFFGRDAFDIKLLQNSGAVLSDALTVHLVDGSAAERLENPEFITHRIAQVSSRTCTPELQTYLPKDVFEELERSDFEPLRAALRQLFSAWL